MGLFDNLFERKTCDICGEKCGVLGGTKLKDGRLCSKCAGKISPWYGYLKNHTLEEVREHLQYREENYEKVKKFNVTHVVGNGGTTLYLDVNTERMIITSNGNWRQYNPDIVSFSQIVDYDLKINESKTEIRKKNEDGQLESYNPKRYDYSYNFYITVNVNASFYNTISIKVNGSSIDGYDNDAYEDAFLASQEICEVLDIIKSGNYDELDETIDYYKNEIAKEKRVYSKTYYADTRAYRKGVDYYKERDPRRSHYRF